MANKARDKTGPEKHVQSTRQASGGSDSLGRARGAYADILALQRAAGNHAVNQLLESSATGRSTIERRTEDAATRIAAPSAGRPLDMGTRAAMEARFDHDLSRVRLHDDNKSAVNALALGARAYTHGWDVVLAPPASSLNGAERGRLLAHELTHVVQQTAPGGTSAIAATAEGEASAIEAGRSGPPQARVPIGIQRQPLEKDEATQAGELLAVRKVSIVKAAGWSVWRSEDERRRAIKGYLAYAGSRPELRELYEEGQRAFGSMLSQEDPQKRKESFQRDLELSKRNPGLMGALLPSLAPHYQRDPARQINDPLLRMNAEASRQAYLGQAKIGKNIVAASYAAMSLLYLFGFVAPLTAEVAASSGAVAVVGGQINLAAGMLRGAASGAVTAGRIFYMSNAIVVNEVGVFTVGLILSCEGNIAGLLKAIADNPEQALPILMEAWVLHATVRAGNAAPRRVRATAVPLPVEQQTDPKALKVRITAIQFEDEPAVKAGSSGPGQVSAPAATSAPPPGAGGPPRPPLKQPGPEDLDFDGQKIKALGPVVRTPIDPSGSGRPARVLEISAGLRETNVGLAPEPDLIHRKQTDLRTPENRFTIRDSVTELDATGRDPDRALPLSEYGTYDAVILNNPRGYPKGSGPNLAYLANALKPGGRIIIQGSYSANPEFRALVKEAAQNPPAGLRVVAQSADPEQKVLKIPFVEDPDPRSLERKPPSVMGGPFFRTGGEETVGWPTARLILEKIR